MKHTAIHSIRFAAIALIFAFATTNIFAQATSVKDENYSFSIFVPCANGGEGEMVNVSGTLHRVTQYQQDNNGCFHVVEHNQPMGMSGVGETTGNTYRATGVTRDVYQEHDFTFCGDACSYTRTYVNNFRLIGPGPGNNYLVHANMVITYNFCGEEPVITIEVENTSTECQ